MSIQVQVDNEQLTVEAQTLGQAIAAARHHLSTAGTSRIIVKVELDGRPLADQALTEQHDRPLEGSVVTLTTEDPYELAQRTLLDVSEALAATSDAQQQAADLLRADHPQQALERVKPVLATWQQAQQSVQQSAELLEIDLDAFTVDDRPASQIIDALAEDLRAVREQLVGSDWVGLADSLGYDLAEALAVWVRMIDALADHIRGLKPDGT